MFAVSTLALVSATFVKVTPGAVVVSVTPPPMAWSKAKPVPSKTKLPANPWPTMA
jgi:hypothetical protein